MAEFTPADKLAILASMVDQTGAVVIEKVKCGCCSGESQILHCWNESVKCPRCSARIASGIPRRPVPGEITAEHLTSAIATYRSAYTGLLEGREVTQEELPGVECERTITEREKAAVEFALLVLDRVARLAEAQARKEASLGEEQVNTGSPGTGVRSAVRPAPAPSEAPPESGGAGGDAGA